MTPKGEIKIKTTRTVVSACCLTRHACGCLGSQHQLSSNATVQITDATRRIEKRNSNPAQSLLLIHPVEGLARNHRVHVCELLDPGLVDFVGLLEGQRGDSETAQRKGKLTGTRN